MFDLHTSSINVLKQASWQTFAKPYPFSTYQASWLFSLDSMTKKLKSHCNFFKVELLAQYQIGNKALSESEKKLLGQGSCLVREVLLWGDGAPWLAARSLIPISTLKGDEKDLAVLGAIPLGERIFASDSAFRDEIEIALIEEKNQLLARRSRLWINNKPLLVAELFLLSAPIYRQEN